MKDMKKEFSRLLQENLDVMYRVALRLAKDPVKAEDLVAETCLKAWKNFETLRKKGSFKPWILKIMRNTYFTKYRRNKRYPKPIPESKFSKEDDDFSLFEQLTNPLFLYQSNPEKEFIKKINLETIHKAVDSLPEKYKEVIILFCLEGMAYKEIANILDLPIGTVRSRLHRGRSMLEKMLWEFSKEKEEE